MLVSFLILPEVSPCDRDQHWVMLCFKSFPSFCSMFCFMFDSWFLSICLQMWPNVSSLVSVEGWFHVLSWFCSIFNIRFDLRFCSRFDFRLYRSFSSCCAPGFGPGLFPCFVWIGVPCVVPSSIQDSDSGGARDSGTCCRFGLFLISLLDVRPLSWPSSGLTPIASPDPVSFFISGISLRLNPVPASDRVSSSTFLQTSFQALLLILSSVALHV
jgi:hypothetical protein